MIKQQKAIVIENELVAASTYLMVIECPAAKLPNRAGQFMHLKVPGSAELLLRRPISINSVNKNAGTISLIIQKKNEGTRRLCAQKPGAVLDVLGPLGKGFSMPKNAKSAAIIGGGIGVAPLRYLMEKYPDVTFDAYIGFRDEDCCYQTGIFDNLSDNLYLLTDDGSIGDKGFVTDILGKNIPEKDYDIIFACGPLPMFQALKKTLEPYDIPCEISMEERMGCGVGACKVCVCETISDGKKDYQKVCQSGPVFDIDEVTLL